MKIYVFKITLLSCFFTLFNSSLAFSQVSSVARDWNNILLFAIRNDFARPTVHARNLYHQSLINYEAWAAFDPSKEHFFLGQNFHGFVCPFDGVTLPLDIESAREKAISYASYRFILNRFQNSPGFGLILNEANNYMNSKNYSIAITSIDYTQGPAELGNYLAQQIQLYGLQDGSNMANNYQNQYYTPVNPPIVPAIPGNSTMIDPNHWQAITLPLSIDQSGNVVQNTPPHLSAEWGEVQPFAMDDSLSQLMFRAGHNYKVFNNPGFPPELIVNDSSSWNSFYKWNHSLVSIWQSHLDPTDGVMWDVSPGSIGNTTWYPNDSTEYALFYDLENGGDAGIGHAINPITGQPYPAQIVPRGDYARVLAEFWADGINSETPPGHWFEIYHQTSSHPLYEFKWGGVGPELTILEYDVKAQLALGGAMHDAAITAWSIKGYHDYVRPISAIRYMADQGQSSDPNLPNYNPAGIPLLPGFIELVNSGDPLAGASNEHVNKLKVYTWRGHDFVQNPLTDMAGVGWILAENWWPYQRPSFVTPPFSGYISGHSTFSRTAAEVMTLLTGTPYFPGGVGEFITEQNEFLEFEEGPSVPVILQWATYRDASDQCSLSRIWGGIHPPCDDIPGRKIGMELGPLCFSKADSLFSSEQAALVNYTWQDTLINLADIGLNRQIVFEFNKPMDISTIPLVSFQNGIVTNVLTNQMPEWMDSTHFRVKFNCQLYPLQTSNVHLTISNLLCQQDFIQSSYTLETNLTIDTKGPVLIGETISAIMINDVTSESDFIVNLSFNEACNTAISPSLSFGNLANPNNTFVLSSNSGWTNDSTYQAIYDVADNNEEWSNVTLSVDNVFDLNVNALVLTQLNQTIEIDTYNPQLLGYDLTSNKFNLDDLVNPLAQLTITFDQEMNTLFIPSISFSQNTTVISNFTGIPSQSYWMNDSTYNFAFFLTNMESTYDSIDISIENTYDFNGNESIGTHLLNVISLDLVRPNVETVTSNKLVIADSEVGTNSYFVDVEFSEKMTTSTKPFVELYSNESTTNSIQYNYLQSEFIDSMHYRAYFIINDLGEEIDSIGVKVQFAEDKNGNTSEAFDLSLFVALDTKNPTILSLFANDYTLETGDVNLTNLQVFSEPMDVLVNPLTTFNDLAIVANAIFTENELETYWITNQTFQQSYAINNVSYSNAGLGFTVSNAKDMAGNLLDSYTLEEFFTLNLNEQLNLNELTNHKIILYPNPLNSADQLLTIQLESEKDDFQCNVFSVEGKFVKSLLFVRTNNMEFSCGDVNIASGIYQLVNDTVGVMLPLRIQD